MYAQNWIRTTSRYYQMLSPVIALGGYLLLGEVWLLAALALLPVATHLATPQADSPAPPLRQTDRLTGLLTRDGFENRMRACFGGAAPAGPTPRLCFSRLMISPTYARAMVRRRQMPSCASQPCACVP